MKRRSIAMATLFAVLVGGPVVADARDTGSGEPPRPLVRVLGGDQRLDGTAQVDSGRPLAVGDVIAELTVTPTGDCESDGVGVEIQDTASVLTSGHVELEISADCKVRVTAIDFEETASTDPATTEAPGVLVPVEGK